jgi:hypothetical protein
MKRIIAICTLLLAASFAVPAFAQAVPYEGQTITMAYAGTPIGSDFDRIGWVLNVKIFPRYPSVSVAVLPAHCGNNGACTPTGWNGLPYFPNRAAAIAAYSGFANQLIAVPLGQ